MLNVVKRTAGTYLVRTDEIGYWAKIDFCDRANAAKRAILLDPAEAYGLKCAFDTDAPNML
jgi:hypothetical protein